MSEQQSQAQDDPQTHVAAEPETVELENIDAVTSDTGGSPESAAHVDGVSPGHDDDANRPADPADELQAENAESSLDQPSEDME